jgi:hypothetical protein
MTTNFFFLVFAPGALFGLSLVGWIWLWLTRERVKATHDRPHA